MALIASFSGKLYGLDSKRVVASTKLVDDIALSDVID